MKIYTRIVVEMFTWKVLEEESYEYTGPVALCGGGGTTVEAAPVDPAVTKLNQMNLNLNEQAIADNAQLRPYQLQAMGLREQGQVVDPATQARAAQLVQEIGAYDSAPEPYRSDPANQAAQRTRLAEMGQINTAAAPSLVKLTEEEQYAAMSPTEKQSFDLQKKAYERTMLAYEGKLPISPAMEQELATQKGLTQENLRRRLGAGWGLSTSGIQSMGDFNTNAELAREEARRGQITSGEGILLARQGFGSGLTQQNYSNYTGYPSSTLGISSGLTNAANPYLQQQNMAFQANVANAQNANQSRSGLMSGLGSLAGLAGGIGLASMTGGASLIPAAAGSIGGGFSKFGNSFSYL
jgi:hypothetical protein